MLRRLRVAILLYVLAFVVAAQYFARARSTDWNDTLWVTVHPVNGDGSADTQAFVDDLDGNDFESVERFFAREARRFGVTLEQPVRIELDRAREVEVPALDGSPSFLDAIFFSLRLRWLASRLDWQSDLPSPDLTAIVVFHAAQTSAALDRSAGLQKGQVALVHAFAAPSSRGSNAVVLAHELAHTLGATDKYDPATGVPLYPEGYGDPAAEPRFPQRLAELMGGRIVIDERAAEIPRALEQVVVGPATAREIGWLPD